MLKIFDVGSKHRSFLNNTPFRGEIITILDLTHGLIEVICLTLVHNDKRFSAGIFEIDSYTFKVEFIYYVENIYQDVSYSIYLFSIKELFFSIKELLRMNIADNFPADFDDHFDPRVGGYTPEEIYGPEPDENYEPEDDYLIETNGK